MRAKRKTETVAEYLDMVHRQMYLKQSNFSRIEKRNAFELEQFFRDLKNLAQNRNATTYFDKEVLETIMYNINLIGKSKWSNFNLSKMFRERGGARFEFELGRVIEAVYYELSDKENFIWDESSVVIGSERSTVRGLSDIFFDAENGIQKKQIEEIGLKTKKKLEDEEKKSVMSKYYFEEVFGKIDVQGYKIDIIGSPKPDLMRIYKLLSSATFSAKNYDSMSFDKQTKSFVEDVGRQNSSLTLGKSNLYRAISGSLISLGVTSKRTIDDMVFGGLENIKKNNDEVASHFYHLRYLYELTGAGIIDSNGKISRVKYLIYNDPHGNIFVKSTADIVANILDAKVSASEGFKTIKIKKSIFD